MCAASAQQYLFRRSGQYRKSLEGLGKGVLPAVEAAWKICCEHNTPFDPRLNFHKINKLTARYGRPVWSLTIEKDLRATFYVDGNTVVFLDIGTHAIYQ